VLGLSLALLTIAGFGAYAIRQIRDLGEEQTAISDRNRKDSLQLLRIQNALALLATAMRDMADRTEPYPMAAWRGTFERIRRDLDEAVAIERGLAPAERGAAQQARLDRTIASYWKTVDQVFRLAAHDERAAAALIRSTLTREHMELVSLVSTFLVANNRVLEEAARANRAIYDRVARGIRILVVALLAVVALAGVWIITASRRAFAEVRKLTTELRGLSWRALRMQEELQRAISRELHDDFAQTVTAVGALLGRARRNVPAGSPLVAELDEVRQIAQEALERIRTRSQWLHPGVLDDFGLEGALARYVEQFERQSGIDLHYTTSGEIGGVGDDLAIHVYRIVQEALSNVSRHSGAKEAWVRLTRDGAWLDVEIEDHGSGFADTPHGAPDADRGIGLVTMRERAELIGGTLELRQPPEGGLVVHVRAPITAAAGEP